MDNRQRYTDYSYREVIKAYGFRRIAELVEYLEGPRALPIREQELMEDEILGFEFRLKVRPGLTGMAQVYDLEDEAHRKLQYDLEYIQNMSLALDLKLLILSVRNTLLGKWDIRTGKQTADQ